MCFPSTAKRAGALRGAAAAFLTGCLLALPAVSFANQAPWVGKTLYGQKCKGKYVAFGGEVLDYRNRANFAGKVEMVEGTHFTKDVESLTKGAADTVMGDLDFTLRVFPNHPRALNSSVRYSLQHKRHPPKEKGLPAECYLQRAINFSPNDPTPYRLYGYYLHRKGHLKEALEINRRAMQLLPQDIMLHYNTGLILADLERYEEAMELAKPLYDAGLTLPGLKRKLVKAGVWEFTPEEVAAFRKRLEERAAANAAEDGTGDDAEPPAAGEGETEETTAANDE